MLASHAALCGFTGSLEMSVFQTLFAGNIGQPGAPGTVVLAGLAERGAALPPAALASRLAAGVADAAAEADRLAGACMVLAAAAAPLPAPALPAPVPLPPAPPPEPAAAGALAETDAGVVACAAGRTWVPHAAIAAPQPAIVTMVSTFTGRRLAG
jgi:hypothetical protein